MLFLVDLTSQVSSSQFPYRLTKLMLPKVERHQKVALFDSHFFTFNSKESST